MLRRADIASLTSPYGSRWPAGPNYSCRCWTGSST